MLQVNQLTGFNAAPALTTLTQVATINDATASSFTLPADIRQGDLIVLINHSAAASTPVTVVPSGFTAILNISNANDRTILSYKLAGGDEDSDVLSGMTGDGSGIVGFIFRGDVPITAVTVQDADSEDTTGDPTAQTVTASASTKPLVVFAGYVTNGDVDPRSFSPAKDDEENVTNYISGTYDLWLANKIYNTAPADVTVNMDDEGVRNMLLSCYIECG
jgi:hypothetical protein